MRQATTKTTSGTAWAGRTTTRSGRGAAFLAPQTALTALTALAALAGTAGLSVVSLGSAPLAGASTRPTTVKAVETDFHIALSKKSFAPGKYTFIAINKGETTHSLKITGNGISNATTKDLSPGQQVKLSVTLKKGAYDIYCPVPGHKALGMNVTITVGGAATASTMSVSRSSDMGGGSSGGASSAGYRY